MDAFNEFIPQMTLRPWPFAYLCIIVRIFYVFAFSFPFLSLNAYSIQQIVYCGRVEAPTSATGIGKVHKREVDEIVQRPFQL